MQCIKAIKRENIGYNGVLFGGNMMAWCDEIAYATAVKLCNHRKMLSKRIESVFVAPVYEGDILHFQCEETSRRKTSIMLKTEVYRDNCLVFFSNSVFVKVGEDNKSMIISRL